MIVDDFGNIEFIISCVLVLFIFLAPVLIMALQKKEQYASGPDVPRSGGRDTPPTSSRPIQVSAPAVPTASGPGAVLGALIVVLGMVIAAGGVLSWLFTDPTNSAVRQIVAALWLLCGLTGSLIAVIGIALIVIERAILDLRRAA
jgi:hypothetical protein